MTNNTSQKLPVAIFGDPNSPLKIGNAELQCYVLDNGERVLSGRGMQAALGLGQSHGAKLKQFLGNKALKEFISEELAMAIQDPIRFIRPGRGGKLAVGFKATILDEICDAVLDAHISGKFTMEDHGSTILQCKILKKAFSKVGIIALVDEATGYQRFRARDELNKILDEFISKELRKWAKTFPDEFYERLFNLRGWHYSPMSVNRPAYVGKLTNNLVYARLAPGVLDELRKKNPTDYKGRRKTRHHQWLTEDVGHPRLREHIASVSALMKAAPNWRSFDSMINRALPKYSETLPILFPDGEEDI